MQGTIGLKISSAQQEDPSIMPMTSQPSEVSLLTCSAACQSQIGIAGTKKTTYSHRDQPFLVATSDFVAMEEQAERGMQSLPVDQSRLAVI